MNKFLIFVILISLVVTGCGRDKFDNNNLNSSKSSSENHDKIFTDNLKNRLSNLESNDENKSINDMSKDLVSTSDKDKIVSSDLNKSIKIVSYSNDEMSRLRSGTLERKPSINAQSVYKKNYPIDENGEITLAFVVISDDEKLKENKKITSDVVLWEFNKKINSGEVTELDPISVPKLTPDNNVVVEIMGSLYCFHGDSGELLWKCDIGGGVEILIMSDGNFVASSYYGEFLTCFNEMGRVIWQIPPDDYFFWPSYVTEVDGELYVDYGDNKIGVFDFEGRYLRDVKVE